MIVQCRGMMWEERTDFLNAVWRDIGGKHSAIRAFETNRKTSSSPLTMRIAIFQNQPG
jgi:hypothetical protein